MTMNGYEEKTELSRGIQATVKEFREISKTLDEHGALEGLPFLPEMRRFCGRTFTVKRRVNKLIQEGVVPGMRRIQDVVLLEGTICDGSAHGDCRRACFPLWKTAWLRARAEDDAPPEASITKAPLEDDESRGSGFPAGFTCQVTEIIRATKPLPRWHPLCHYWDMAAETYSIKDYVAYLLGGIYRRIVKPIKAKLVGAGIKLTLSASSPPLDLNAGDLVEVKSASEIRATLDQNGKTRGLFFMPGMWEYCGRRIRVLQPVDKMISEATGEMRTLCQTVILEGITCNGKAHGGCQRGCYVFWKGTWLRCIAKNPGGGQPKRPPIF